MSDAETGLERMPHGSRRGRLTDQHAKHLTITTLIIVAAFMLLGGGGYMGGQPYAYARQPA